MFFMHPFPSLSSSQPLQSHSLLSISIPFLSFHSISSFSFSCYLSFDSSFLNVQWYTRPSVSIAHFNLILSYSHSSIFHSTHTIHVVSSLLISCLNYEINILFVRIVVIACSFGVLIGNTLSQLDVLAFASDGWFESSSIEWWGNERMRTWGLEGIGEVEAEITEVDSIRW